MRVSDSFSVVHLVAPSRLHFGMFSFGDARRRQFGGVGVMLDKPALTLTVSPADQLEISGPLADRVERCVRRWAEFRKIDMTPRRLTLASAPPRHVGLGSGTQLALSVGAALNASFGYPRMPPIELATCMGRGLRSAVGTYGFFYGGLLLEEGKLAGEALAPLRERVVIPAEWRFVLLRPHQGEGLFGDEERRAFRDLPPTPESVTRRLWRIAESQMIPALRRGDCDAFGESVYHFGREAGMCFAARQGGPFANERVAHWIETIRHMGVAGVGQSSWGPMVFAVLPNGNEAKAFVEKFVDRVGDEPPRWIIAPPNNTGATLEIGGG